MVETDDGKSTDAFAVADLEREKNSDISEMLEDVCFFAGSATIDLQLYEKLKIYHRFRIVCAAFSMVKNILFSMGSLLLPRIASFPMPTNSVNRQNSSKHQLFVENTQLLAWCLETEDALNLVNIFLHINERKMELPG